MSNAADGLPSGPPDWEQRYRTGDTPWDTGQPEPELLAVLDSKLVQPGTAIELGCGTGTNAVLLAQHGFSVTAVDLSSLALEAARRRAAEAAVGVEFMQADVLRLPTPQVPFDFVLDRGCYHCVRRLDVAGMVATLARITQPGSKMLLLTGNANEQHEGGPPTVTEEELRAELGGLFHFEHVRSFRFENPGGGAGPLGWSCLLTRRP